MSNCSFRFAAVQQRLPAARRFKAVVTGADPCHVRGVGEVASEASSSLASKACGLKEQLSELGRVSVSSFKSLGSRR